MLNSGWYCPFCNAHHAPHIETCPSQNARGVRYVPLKRDSSTITFDAVIPVVKDEVKEKHQSLR